MHRSLENTRHVAIDKAVHETMRRVSNSALYLLRRQTEINRRIRDLHRVIRNLQRLATNPGFNGATSAAHQASRGEFGRTEPNSLRTLYSPVQSRHSLSRACRIALLEASGPASLDEIRSRILRRRSFSFPDAAGMNLAILRTLSRMTSEGEILGLRSNGDKRWQRIEWSPEIDADYPSA